MATAIRQQSMFIGGDWTAAAEGKTLQVVNPATGETIAETPAADEKDVDRAVQIAQKAFDEVWFDTTPSERQSMLLKLADAIDRHAEEIGRLESENVGKPLATVMSEEMPVMTDHLRFFAGGARLLEGRAAGEYFKAEGTLYTSMLRREPIGVVGLIAPWNYPLWMAIWKFGPALAADIFPPGVFNVITGEGEPTGAALVKHPGVGMVSLTGEVTTGKAVARAAADTLKRVHLELGGKAPVIVFDDANLESSVEWIKIAGYFNSGQDCTAACRVLAGPTIYENLVSELVPAVESLKVGEPRNEDTEMGPLVAGEHFDRVKGFVDRARESGAKVLTGGEPLGGPGFFFKPTVITGVGQDAEIVRREVFGPVVTVQRFEDDDEGLGWANDVDYGL